MCNNSIILAGPTAVGKTSLSIKLAKNLNMEIISADATQVYKELNIGSAKITENEKKGIKHHLIDITSIKNIYSVGLYYKDVNNILNSNKNKNYIITGGTGLYIDSIVNGLSDLPKANLEKRKKLEKLSLEELVKILVDKNLDENIDIKNRVRVIRKLELGDFKHKIIKGNDRNFLKIFLTRERESLYNRINKRVDLMLENGLVDEAYNIYQKYGDIVKSIGYKELNEYFKNEINLEKAIDLIKRNSRRYAKRQFTWFKNKGYKVYDVEKYSEDELVNLIRSEYEFRKYFK